MAAVGPSPGVSHAERWGHGVVAILLAGVLAASFLGVDRWHFTRAPREAGAVRPDEPSGQGFTICALRNLTGLPCPTCGMTRSFCSLGRGDFGAAVRRHPLGPLLFLVFILLLVRSTVIMVTGRPWLPRTARLMVWSIVPLVLVALAIWGVRLAMMLADGTAARLWHASLLGRLLG